MPVAIAWLLIAPVAELILSLFALDENLRTLGAQVDVLGISSPLIWLVVPVVLAAWQYGWRGLRATFSALVGAHIALGIALWSNTQFIAGFILNSAGRLAMLAILAYLVLLLVQAQQKDHAALEQANRQLDQRATTAAQLAESRERNRMARELHDILAHSLTALSIQLQAASKLIDPDPGAAKEQLREAHLTTRTSANEVRRAIQALRATPLQDLGLAEALRELCRAQAERTGAQFDCTVADVPALDPLTEQTVYRIASEALANVEKHAAATQVTVKLEMRAQTLRLTIQDDGAGFDAEKIPAGHYGLLGMTERARDIGGALRVTSGARGGTRVELEAAI